MTNSDLKMEFIIIKKIINAIEKKDASAAKSSMHDHLKHAIDRLGYS